MEVTTVDVVVESHCGWIERGQIEKRSCEPEMDGVW